MIGVLLSAIFLEFELTEQFLLVLTEFIYGAFLLEQGFVLFFELLILVDDGTFQD